MKKICLIGMIMISLLGTVGCVSSTNDTLAVETDENSYNIGVKKCDDTIGKDKKLKITDIVNYTVELSSNKKIKDEASFIDGFVDTMYDKYDKPALKYLAGSNELIEWTNIPEVKEKIFDLVIIQPESNYELEDVVESLKDIAIDDIMYNNKSNIEALEEDLTVDLTDDCKDENGKIVLKEDKFIFLRIFGGSHDTMGDLVYDYTTGDYRIVVNKDKTFE